MEIERKFLVSNPPEKLDSYESHLIEQGYLNNKPVIRIRKSDNTYTLTYKGGGLMAREEYNLPLDENAYFHLREKIDGKLISKRRYLIPISQPEFQDGFSVTEPVSLIIELDEFYSPRPFFMAEVEFPSIEMANAFIAPSWFDKDVTMDPCYHNSNMSLSD